MYPVPRNEINMVREVTMLVCDNSPTGIRKVCPTNLGLGISCQTHLFNASGNSELQGEQDEKTVGGAIFTRA